MAKAIKLKLDCLTSTQRNAPLWKIVPINGSAKIINPITDGTDRKKISLKAFSNCELNANKSFLAKDLERVGRRTVPIAIAKIPNGNCINLSET